MSEIVMGLPNYVEDERSRYIEANVSGMVFPQYICQMVIP